MRTIRILGALSFAALAMTGCDATAPEIPASITLPADVATLDAIGRTVKLGAIAKNAAGNEMIIDQLAWTSGNTGVVTVDNSGTVTAKGEGDGSITATYAPGIAGTAVLKVRATIAFTAEPGGMTNAVVDAAKSKAAGSLVVHAK